MTNRYLLIIRNEENFAEKKTISFNYARAILVFTAVFSSMMILAFYLTSAVLNRWLSPGYVQNQANRQIIELSMAVDSLGQEVEAKDLYISNIRLILAGRDSIYSALSNQQASLNPDSKPTNAADFVEIDSQFRADYEQNDLQLVKFISTEAGELGDMYLFQPIEGIITDGFDADTGHYGVDIVAKENEPVKSVADGIVVFSSWTLEFGYVIGIQHTRGSLISMYKHNSELLKNVGSFVSRGEIIAIIGNTGELTSGPHLHFELWHRGNAINPEDYIAF